MKKPIAIGFLFIFCLVNAEQWRCTQLPGFIKHYQLHISKDPSLSVFQFLKLHYIEDHGLAVEHLQDIPIPFASIKKNSTVWLFSSEIEISYSLVNPLMILKYGFLDQDDTSIDFQDSLFRPPSI